MPRANLGWAGGIRSRVDRDTGVNHNYRDDFGARTWGLQYAWLVQEGMLRKRAMYRALKELADPSPEVQAQGIRPKEQGNGTGDLAR
jgi:hypothetical protein